MSSSKRRVLIAGAGGASLGTETLKALAMTGRYEAVVADVSPMAYGLYQPQAAAGHVLRVESYMDDLIACCQREGVGLLVPGAEATLKLINGARQRLLEAGITPVLNRSEVIQACSDKSITFDVLKKLGIPVPQTRVLTCAEDLDDFPVPCIIKPATETGGSALVSAASTRTEALMYAQWIWTAGLKAIAQEYLPHSDGEFTVGVLRFGSWTGSIAMKREFPCKLSYLLKNEKFLISSGYSQGLIDVFPEVCAQAERIAVALDSQGPLNIQGRFVNGMFYPFEINPRFSATTYLRAMAGFTEIEIFLNHLAGEDSPPKPQIKPGYYLRSLAEMYVPADRIKNAL
ncbi:ATP-grasp domain-containing protein [Prosthecobacter sp.]|jgi:carbamoyl-phosphate synthase large subunit|uniref:ATP-grasp domain-containing protein n=1 Tax=Prosthecobacter sp. TaxID=1965333 RepID=UPI0037CB1E49